MVLAKVKELARLGFPAHSLDMLADEQTSPEQFAILRAMPGTRRLQLAERMYWAARKLKTAGVRSQHPDWPEEKVITEVNRIFLNVRD